MTCAAQKQQSGPPPCCGSYDYYVTAPAPCQACTAQFCCGQALACTSGTPCDAYARCYDSCDRLPDVVACFHACDQQYLDSAAPTAAALDRCQNDHCYAQCVAPPLGDAGSGD
jgi:hypothetical protein